MATVSQSTALEIALRYHRAWTSGDVDSAMTHVADDVVCHAPGREIRGKADYQDFLNGFAPRLTGLTDIAAFGDEDHVVLFYCPHTAATSTAPAAEHMTIRDGLIVTSDLVFDRLSFGPPPGK